MVTLILSGDLEIQSLIVIKIKMMANMNMNTARGFKKKCPWYSK